MAYADDVPIAAIPAILDRLDKHEQMLADLKDALDIQFKRIAEIQAQLDLLAARLSKDKA